MLSGRARLVSTALLVVLITTAAFVSAPAGDPLKQIIIRCSPGQLEKIKARFGLTILDAIPEAEIYLVVVNSAVTPAELKKADLISTKHILAGENFVLSVPARRPAATGTRASEPTSLSLADSFNYYTSNAPDAYVNQPAAKKIRTRDAHRFSTGRRAVIALIDTGVDEEHPVLRNSLVRGRNYVLPSGSPSEWNDPTLSQSVMRAYVLNQSVMRAYVLNQSVMRAYVLNQSVMRAYILNQSVMRPYILNEIIEVLDNLPPVFGHGTMTAGLAHLVAPEALLMPMKAADANGSLTVFNVVRATRDAVNMGADVINMSFSSENRSEILESVMEYATSRGVVVVASAGNDNSGTPTVPASLDNVVGVTSLTIEDRKAPFSNYGKYIAVSGPGVDMVSTYPLGTFAIADGTSFTAPLAAGLAALLRELGEEGEDAQSIIEDSADPIDSLNPGYEGRLGEGRINALNAVRRR